MPSRIDTSFPSDDARCAAYVYRPDDEGQEGGRRPCVLMAHGLSGTREDRLPTFADRFAAAGFVVVLFDCRHLGASEGQPRQLVDIGRQQEDYRSAVRFARTLEGVDPDRIALWGSSFSGGHARVVAAEDPRIAAVVAQMPYTDGLSAARLVSLRDIARLTVAGLRDQIGAWLGRAPYTLPSAGGPGELAVMTAPEAVPGLRDMVAPHSLWKSDIPARILFPMLFYRPVRHAAKVSAPMLICACDNDQTTPVGPTLRAAKRAPRGELVRYPIGHFGIYAGGANLERAITDQTDFLVRHLDPSRVAR
jgi:fermentation-respiration switch protein FrsA (DUF1100 family)